MGMRGPKNDRSDPRPSGRITTSACPVHRRRISPRVSPATPDVENPISCAPIQPGESMLTSATQRASRSSNCSSQYQVLPAYRPLEWAGHHAILTPRRSCFWDSTVPVPTQRHSRWHYPSHHNPRSHSGCPPAHTPAFHRPARLQGSEDAHIHTAVRCAPSRYGCRLQASARAVWILCHSFSGPPRKIRIGFSVFRLRGAPHRADRLVVKHRLLAGPQMDQALYTVSPQLLNIVLIKIVPNHDAAPRPRVPILLLSWASAGRGHGHHKTRGRSLRPDNGGEGTGKASKV